ncbi:RNA-guided endonuclease TnpB family protein [Methanolobus vulcani]|uniref:IS200/IS605 family element transposase accessory protein TnpB n=1 Tax=Methanolobus vulcani TaxID=38026 RepID=A0A7Z8P2V7_9EURY|nr:RNA-guided endonuclease TnpB family protein [Methanolobus vulcani]TQD27578.1 IS200/IS605 family element transposase accessory protein TnpB [Methanolobus vulcani]
MQLTLSIKIQSTPEQESVLWDLSEKCRLIYNFGLKERQDAYRNKTKIGYIQQQNKLPEIKQKYPDYKIVYSKVLQGCLKCLDNDYKSFFNLIKNKDTKARPPGFKGKKYFTTMIYNQSGFSITDSNDNVLVSKSMDTRIHKPEIEYSEQDKIYIDFSHKHPSKIPLIFELPAILLEKQIFSKATDIDQVNIYQKDKEFYISITYEVPAVKHCNNNSYLAIDIGSSKQTMVDSDGKFKELKNRRPDKYWESKIQSIQSRRDHCKNRSRKWKRLNKNLVRMKRKSSNQLKDNQHKITRNIVENTDANTIIIGKLDVKQMASKKPKASKKDKSTNRGTHNSGHIGRFAQFLTYKAESLGKRVIRIDESYTSKKCCVCGTIKDMPLGYRTYECDCCGNILDRDMNSSVNILLRYFKHNALWTSYQSMIDNLRQTGLLIGIIPNRMIMK